MATSLGVSCETVAEEATVLEAVTRREQVKIQQKEIRTEFNRLVG
jgi:hypothetical protein